MKVVASGGATTPEFSGSLFGPEDNFNDLLRGVPIGGAPNPSESIDNSAHTIAAASLLAPVSKPDAHSIVRQLLAHDATEFATTSASTHSAALRDEVGAPPRAHELDDSKLGLARTAAQAKLTNNDWRVRSDAVLALGGSELPSDPVSIKALEGVAAADPNPNVRLYALVELQRLPENYHPPAKFFIDCFFNEQSVSNQRFILRAIPNLAPGLVADALNLCALVADRPSLVCEAVNAIHFGANRDIAQFFYDGENAKQIPSNVFAGAFAVSQLSNLRSIEDNLARGLNQSDTIQTLRDRIDKAIPSQMGKLPIHYSSGPVSVEHEVFASLLSNLFTMNHRFSLPGINLAELIDQDWVTPEVLEYLADGIRLNPGAVFCAPQGEEDLPTTIAGALVARQVYAADPEAFHEVLVDLEYSENPRTQSLRLASKIPELAGEVDTATVASLIKGADQEQRGYGLRIAAMHPHAQFIEPLLDAISDLVPGKDLTIAIQALQASAALSQSTVKELAEKLSAVGVRFKVGDRWEGREIDLIARNAATFSASDESRKRVVDESARTISFFSNQTKIMESVDWLINYGGQEGIDAVCKKLSSVPLQEGRKVLIMEQLQDAGQISKLSSSQTSYVAQLFLNAENSKTSDAAASLLRRKGSNGDINLDLFEKLLESFKDALSCGRISVGHGEVLLRDTVGRFQYRFERSAAESGRVCKTLFECAQLLNEQVEQRLEKGRELRWPIPSIPSTIEMVRAMFEPAKNAFVAAVEFGKEGQVKPGRELLKTSISASEFIGTPQVGAEAALLNLGEDIIRSGSVKNYLSNIAPLAASVAKGINSLGISNQRSDLIVDRFYDMLVNDHVEYFSLAKSRVLAKEVARYRLGRALNQDDAMSGIEITT